MVARHRDFDSLYDQYQVTARFEFWRRLYRNPRFFAGLVAVVAVAYLVFEAASPDPALPDLRPVPGPAWEVAAVPAAGMTLADDSLRITVPPTAFETLDGVPIEEPVSLRYRRLPGPPAYLASGLDFGPEAGLETPYTSLGLVELAAFSDSQQVRLRTGIEISVTMLTP
ncbi:MAG: hypothetical protein D6722_27745, partial [Bacteroidetes bacterium]